MTIPPEGARSRYRIEPGRLRWRCDPAEFGFETTRDIGDCPIEIIGQDRAQDALRLGLRIRSDGYNIVAVGEVGSGRSTVVRRLLDQLESDAPPPDDLAYVHDFDEPERPRLVRLPAGRGGALAQAMAEMIEGLVEDLPRLFDSDEYRKRRGARVESASREQKESLKAFEKRVQEQGFALVEVPMGPLVRPQLMPVVAGNPVAMDQLESLVEAGKFKREEFEAYRDKLGSLGGELEALGKHFRNLDRELRRALAELDRTLARPLVEEAAGEVRSAFDVDRVGAFLDQVVADILDRLDEFRQSGDTPAGEGGATGEGADRSRYVVNVIVDNARTTGRPVIHETAPTYRNLFGTIDKVRGGNGEWYTEHTRIRAGSLMRSNSGFLVLDALDVLVEPGVWPALKRSLRNRVAEIQVFDALQMLSGTSLKPEPVPIDVKVVLIGTRQIYALLSALDEDFGKIFKVKAEFARRTPLSVAERRNYACFVHKKIGDDGLPPFHNTAVASIIEHGARLAGDQRKLTTRFTEIADVIRESGYWAREAGAEVVLDEHVDRAVAERRRRVNLTEEMMRERIVEGEVLIDLEGEAVGQVNGLAVLDTGDHRFGQPTRITATTAVGRVGIIDLERQASMSGPTHTKGVLILTAFLRARFAQDKPLALTATLCFEQSYGGIDGDSGSSAELYALLSSLSGVALSQSIAVTGSVDQRGEIQPIGGANEKIEGFFDLCRIKGLDGTHGVLLPERNLPHLMLRREVVDAVADGSFHIWAVATIEQGLEVLTGVPAGEPLAGGGYPEESIFARVDARLRQLIEEVGRHGVADLGQLR